MKLATRVNLLTLATLLLVSAAMLVATIWVLSGTHRRSHERLMRLELQATVQAIVLRLQRVGVRAAGEEAGAQLQRLSAQEGLTSAKLFVVEQPGSRIVYRPGAAPGEPLQRSFVQEMVQLGQGTLAYVDGGQRRLAVFQTLEPIGWLVVLEVAQREIDAALRQLLTAIIGIGITALLFGGAMASLFGQQLSKRLARVLDVVRRIESGDLGARLPDHGPDDEVRALKRGINGMAKSLQERSAELTQTQLRLDLALAAGRMGVWDWDSASGQSHWNRHMFDLLGLPAHEDGLAQGDLFMAMVHAQDRAAVEAAVTQALEGSAGLEMEMRLVRADGELRWVLSRAQVVCDEHGRALRMVGVSLDISAQKAAQAALAEALKAKDTLLYEVHHRVKNNLQIINSLLSLQRRSVKDPDGQRAIEEAASRVAVMANLHLDLYQSGRHGAVELRRWFARLANDTLRLLGGGKTIVLDYQAPDELVISANDAVPLSLAVSELLTNAVKYAFSQSRRGTVSLHVHRSDGQLRVLVADDGGGLPPGFDPYTSTGLGMRIVRALVRQLGAQLKVLQPSGGASFLIEMPLGGEPETWALGSI